MIFQDFLLSEGRENPGPCGSGKGGARDQTVHKRQPGKRCPGWRLGLYNERCLVLGLPSLLNSITQLRSLGRPGFTDAAAALGLVLPEGSLGLLSFLLPLIPGPLVTPMGAFSQKGPLGPSSHCP